MCSVYAYGKDHVPMTSDASSGGGIPITSMSYNETLLSLVHTINSIDNWFQCFEAYMVMTD